MPRPSVLAQFDRMNETGAIFTPHVYTTCEDDNGDDCPFCWSRVAIDTRAADTWGGTGPDVEPDTSSYDRAAQAVG